MPLRVGQILSFLLKDWHIKLLAVLSALFLWLYVEVKEKVPFQVQLKITEVPKGYEVFPHEVLIAGKIAEKFNRLQVLHCFKVSLRWDGKEPYATVEVKPPLPKPLVEIESIYPQRVEIRKITP